ncbi:DUF885 domain-containing protein [Massilia violaceinigra]|uniref:DUF885 domain-containing protein n=1 Tax=Massilia violaceinigra TaxID=2045208 RepID=A0A2D2DRP6_9BURK|nr:DUF885 domain-containing protein [Massilia violaceinigra]ATQ77647.1 DUF885 domain-containing protein [Massilia violaceinigra]
MPTPFQRAVAPRLIAALVALSLGGAAVPVLAATPGAGAGAAAAVDKRDAAFDKWADGFAADWVRLSPQRATVDQYFRGAEQQALDRQLTPITVAHRARYAALARAGVARLDRFLAGSLDSTQRVSAETMRWSLANHLAGERFEDHAFVFSQFGGTHIALVSFMSAAHPMRRAADVDSYLARLAQIGERMDQANARTRAAAARGLLPPRFILERAQGQVDAFLKPAADKNVLVLALAERSAALADLTPAARAAAIDKAAAIVGKSVLPAYARSQALLAELHPKTGDAAGIARLPDGAAAYSHALASFTGTTLNAAHIHAIGLREVARIEGEMDRHLRQLGFTDGSIDARMKALDKTFQPAAEPDPRAAILAGYAAMVRDAEQRSARLFNLKPRAPVEVRREPPLTEGSASAHYSVPAPDGSLPGIFWVPLRGPAFDMIRMRSLAYHEAVPGHHFQLAIQQELSGLPAWRRQRIFGGGSAHSEGWALYTERLAVEQGWYEGDVPGLLGALGSELFRARRLVVDTGLHSKGWTRQQAIDYGIGAAEVERYVVWPGQACAYMLGMLRILELREKARLALGERFTLPAFHDVILKNGSVPLDVLGKIIDQWIADQSKPAAT